LEILANVDVGTYPGGIATTADYAVVACAFSDEVHVIDLSDYSIAGIFPTGEQPWVVRISPDQHYAYVGCDIDDVCEVINLETMTHERTIAGFPVFLLQWGGITEQGRNSFEFTDFEVTPDGIHLIVGDFDRSLYFFNTQTGAIDHSISGITDGVKVSLSGDGLYAVVTTTTSPAEVHQIDLTTYTRTKTVTITAGPHSMCYDAAVNQDGSKAFVAVSGNQSAIVRFATGDYSLIADTNTPFWIGVTPDHAHAVGGQYRFSIIDLDRETIRGQLEGLTQSYGSVSAGHMRAVGYDPLRYEGIYFYDITDPTAPVYRGTQIAGGEPEGDAPRRLAITPDGRQAVITNVLSGNATFLNLETLAIEAIVPMGDRVQNVAITSDGLWAVVCGFNSNSVKIVDLTTHTVVADVPAGTRAGVVDITPDDQYAYVGNISSNTISVIALQGASSYEVTEFACGIIGVSYAAYTVSSDVKASPDGAHVLVAVSFEDQVKVIDTATQAIVAALPAGDFPLQIAFNATGDYAIVTNYTDHTYTVMHIDGANSSVVGTYSTPGETNPLRIAYNPVADEIGIGYYTSKALVRVDPETGAYLGREDFTAYGSLIQVHYDPPSGEAVVLTGSADDAPGHLHRGGEAIPLPAVPAYVDYVPGVAVTAAPGPDWVTVVRWDAAGAADPIDLPMGAGGWLSPSGATILRGGASLAFTLARPGPIDLSLVDVAGRCAARLAQGHRSAGRHQVAWEPGDLDPGMYEVVLRLGGHLADSRKVVVLE